MDVIVLLIFSSFFAALTAAATANGGLRASVRRPRIFQNVAASEVGAVGPVWAFYSVLSCIISAYALLRRRARGAIDPQEG